MMRRVMMLCLAVTLAGRAAIGADDEVFSGPQPGERLVSFKMKGVFSGETDKEIDLVAKADGKPMVLVFFHQRTRPAFSLTNTVMRMAASRKQAGLVAGVCFLTDDPTATENWMRRIPHYFTEGVSHGISLDGQEGPGSYGLNRNVALTVLVGKGNEVTANFALVQPSVQADGPKIFKAVVEAVGGGEVPELAQFAQNRYAVRQMRLDRNLQQLVRPILRKNATPEEVITAAKAVEAYLAENKRARGQLAAACEEYLRSAGIRESATQPALVKLREWARKYARPQNRRRKDG